SGLMEHQTFYSRGAAAKRGGLLDSRRSRLYRESRLRILCTVYRARSRHPGTSQAEQEQVCGDLQPPTVHQCSALALTRESSADLRAEHAKFSGICCPTATGEWRNHQAAIAGQWIL